MLKSLTYFEELFKANFNSLCNVANQIIKDKEASKDIVQEIFVKLWRREEELATFTNIKGYLYKATTNASINYLLQSKKTIPIGDLNIAHAADANDNIAYKELENKIEQALNNLPPKCKAIFILSRFEGLKYKEIAGHLDISVKTVENQMGIALSKMREELKPFLTREFLSLAFSAGTSLLIHFLSILFILFLVQTIT